MATWKEKYNKKYDYPKSESHSLSDISKDTGVSKKGLQQIYNKGIGAYKTNPQSVRPTVTSKEQWAMARVYSSVMGGKASKVDAKELKMQIGGSLDNKQIITKVVLTDFDKKGYFGQYKKVFDAFNKEYSLGFVDGAYELDRSGERDSNGNYILLVSDDLGGGVEERLSKIKGISFEEIYIDKNVLQMGGSTDDFNRTDYYKGYYERLSPSDFVVEKENEKITINMNNRYKSGGRIFPQQAVMHDGIDEVDAIANSMFEKGGETDFNPDGKIKDKIVHASGEAGGMLVGKRHSNGGIKALNKSTGQPLEMEGGEVVITRDAVSDNKKRSFNGKMMTNRQILSAINESGGGVSFADGGQVPNDLQFDCNAEYEYGGKTMCGKDLAYALGGVTNYSKDGNDVIDVFLEKSPNEKYFGDFDDLLVNGKVISKNKFNPYIKDNMVILDSDYDWLAIKKNNTVEIGFGYGSSGLIDDIQYLIQEKALQNGLDVKVDVLKRLASNNKYYIKNGLIALNPNYALGGVTTAIVTDPNEAMADLQSTYGFGDVYAKGGTIECGSCDWSWDRKDGGDDMYVCHRCGTDNEKYFGTDNSFEEDKSFKDGGELTTFEYPLTANNKALLYNKAIISTYINGTTVLGIIEDIADFNLTMRIIYQENYDIREISKVYSIYENELIDILNGKPLSTNEGTFSYVSNINNIKELSLFQIKTARDILKEYGTYLKFSIPDFFDKVLNTDEPTVDSIRVIEKYNSYQEIYKEYVQGKAVTSRYGDRIGFTTNHDNGTVHHFRIGKRKVIVNDDDNYWRIGNGKKIASYYDWLLSLYGNRDRDVLSKYNYEKFVTGTSKEYVKQQQIQKEKEKKERKERQLLEANVFNYEKNFSLMNEIAEKGIWKDLGFSEPFEGEKLNVEKDYSKLKVDLMMLKDLLPNFQGSKDLIQRKRILKEMKKIQDKINGVGIEVNETLANTNDLFTSEGLLNYYFTQSTQSPVLKLDKPCGLPTPNGEKSRLPLSAYLNVRTKEFKNWFGDWEVAYNTNNYNGCSIMIDEDTKEPKIYYHGVAKFRGVRGKGAMGSGVRRPYGAFTPTNFNASYFADNMEYAKFYSGTSDLLPTRFKTDGFVYSLFLNVRNPIDLLPLGLKCSYKNIKDYLLVAYGIELEYNNVLLEKMDNDVNSINNTWQYIRNDELLIERLKDFGYDCIFQVGDIPKYDKKTEKVIGSIEDKEFLTFYPNQVKSVGVLKSFYGNMFDDIRFKKGGYVSI